ncbi:MAG: cytochrome c biogenesis protein CcdA [Candidatus Margulisbacteria bacterium]|nr:cytochrome c biogenesis protein CcdA [Candidatus Margulisiibacteriota bacterium]
MNLAIAFGGGLLAFFSPCFLPLVPAYLVYITGLSFEELKDVRFKTIVHSLLFIAGFMIIFTLMGVAAGLLGESLFKFRDLLRILGGTLIIFLGLYFLQVVKLPWLDIERRATIADKPSGYLGTVYIGMVFAVGWTPCVGPILASILTLAAQSGMAGQGALMLIAFSLGLGLPLFLVSLAVDSALAWFKEIKKYLPTIHFVCGVFLVLIGILLVTNYLQTMSLWLIDVTGYKGI